MDEWYSVYRGGTGQIEEKKSRFIATLEPVSSEEEAAAFIAGIKKKYWDARHNCSAFIIGDNGDRTRCSDDGEPSGTAGRPMLDVLANEHVTNVCVVVTRYFGGTLLGTGGLVRAYSAAVKVGLKNCEIIRKIRGFEVGFNCEYNDFGKVQNLCGTNGYLIDKIDYGEKVSFVIITEDEGRIIKDITDITSGRAVTGEIVPTVYAVTGGNIMRFDVG